MTDKLTLADIDTLRDILDKNAQVAVDSNKEVEEFENELIKQGGKLYRSEDYGFIQLNDIIYPARSARQIRWNVELFSPKGLLTVFQRI